MGLKLRESVEYVTTSDDVLVRSGHRVLRIGGQNTGNGFASMVSLLDGTYSRSTLAENSSSPKRSALLKLVDTLQAAGLLYETSDSTPSMARIIAIGADDLLADFVDAARLFSPEKKMDPGAASSTTESRRLEVSVRGFTSAPKDSAQYKGFDAVVLAADNHRDATPLNEIRQALEASGVQTIPLFVCGNFVVTGLIETDTCCPWCVAAHYRRVQPQAESGAGPHSALSIASHILALQLSSLRSHDAIERRRQVVYEVSTQDLEIRLRSVSPHPECDRCGPLELIDRSRDPISSTEPSFDVLEFSKTLESRVLDEHCGVLAKVDEEDLLQLPAHQCAAEWAQPGKRPIRVRTNEIGPDYQTTRFRTIRFALEQYVSELLSSSMGGQTKPACSDPSATVVSGLHNAELMANALFVGLSRVAQNRSEWEELPCSDLMTSGPRSTMAEYLKDIGVWQHISVERYSPLQQGPCECLRFFYQKELLSVVSGWRGCANWAVGMGDVWLYVTGGQLKPNLQGVPKVRLRSSVPEISEEELRQTLSTLGCSLDLSYISGTLPRLIAPLRFALATLIEQPSSATSNPID